MSEALTFQSSGQGSTCFKTGVFVLCDHMTWRSTQPRKIDHNQLTSFRSPSCGSVGVSQWISSLSSISFLSVTYRCGNSSSCPFFNAISPRFALPSSSLFTFSCSLKDYIGDTVMMCYMSEPVIFFFVSAPASLVLNG